MTKGEVAEKKRQWLPILNWLPNYNRSWLTIDILAGLTIIALLVPEGMAYAELAGMPPQAAFYAAPIGLLLYAVFGSSRQLVVAVSSAIAVMSASVIGGFAPLDTPEFIALTSALAIMTGLVAMLAGVLRLGRVAQFFSESVLTGFVTGLALVIGIKQLPKLFGLEGGHGNFWERLIEFVTHLPEAHLATAVIGVTTVLLMLFLEHRFRRIPAALVAMVYGILVVTLFGLANQGVHIIGEIPAGLAPPRIPNIPLIDFARLIPSAFALTLVMFAEAIGPARSFAAKHGYKVDADQELIGLGAANFGAGLFQGFPIGASLSKSAASDAAGSHSQVSGMVAAVGTAIVALFLTPLFYNLPEAALGAIVIVAISGMVKVADFRRLYRLRRGDFGLAVVAMLGVLTFDEVLYGLLVAVIVSLLALIWRASQPNLSVLGREPGRLAFSDVSRHPENEPVDGILLLRFDESLFFANATPLLERVLEAVMGAHPKPHNVLIDIEMSYDLDVPSADMLLELEAELRSMGIGLQLSRVHGEVYPILEKVGVIDAVGVENVFPSALDALVEHLVAYDSSSVTLLAALDISLQRVREMIVALQSQASAEDRARFEQLLARLDAVAVELEEKRAEFDASSGTDKVD